MRYAFHLLLLYLNCLCADWIFMNNVQTQLVYVQ